MSESSQLKTWNFVWHGLLSREGEHERAFRVIEIELAFLYDFFCTNYYALFTTGFLSPTFKIMLCNCCSHSKALHTLNEDLNLLTGRDVDVQVTVILSFSWKLFNFWLSNSPIGLRYSGFAFMLKNPHGKTINSLRRLYKLSATRNDFWADMMFFVAPSDDTTVHAENLIKGGEFVTHLWA
ncbi:hypothetical protein CFP56_000399 [Quercus suber]|uniref:DUF4220 domain-containing protein n=1 Tax=Quercus suber TaxID=58331 RepID=A0AAW0MA81_QUESU